MTLFLILAAVLVAGALLLVVPPMFGLGARHKAHQMNQKQAETVLVLMREQLVELDADRAAGKLSDAEHARARTEVEQRALEEGRAVEDGADQGPARGWALGMVVLVPLLAVVVYLAIGAPEGVSPAALVPEQAREQVTPEEMAVLVARLVDRLEEDPTDETGWVMLARSYAMLGDLDTAAQTWGRIGDRAPADAMILTDWADILVAAQDGDFAGEPQRLIDRALALEPDHFKARALAGAAAFERGEYVAASEHWEQILLQVPREDPAYASVVASINEARTRGDMPLLQTATPAPASPTAGQGEDAAAAALPLKGRVRLAEALADGVEDQTVFVFVRAEQGGPPFAALRLSASELPVTFDFTAAPRMNDAPLPARVVVAARVSQQGGATAQSGDLEGFSAPVSPDASDVEVVIDQIRP